MRGYLGEPARDRHRLGSERDVAGERRTHRNDGDGGDGKGHPGPQHSGPGPS